MQLYKFATGEVLRSDILKKVQLITTVSDDFSQQYQFAIYIEGLENPLFICGADEILIKEERNKLIQFIEMYS